MRVDSRRPTTPAQEDIAFIVVDAGDENDWLMEVPRYEEGHALPALAQTAFEPFPL